jgi:hypothetical protein
MRPEDFLKMRFFLDFLRMGWIPAEEGKAQAPLERFYTTRNHEDDPRKSQPFLLQWLLCEQQTWIGLHRPFGST